MFWLRRLWLLVFLAGWSLSTPEIACWLSALLEIRHPVQAAQDQPAADAIVVLDGGRSAAYPPELAVCSKALLAPVANDLAKTGGNRFVLEDLQCAGDWAVVSGLLGPEVAPADGPQGVATTRIFRFEGGAWQPRTSDAVCGRYNPDHPDAVPTDATIPARLYVLGCLVG